jgi:predicted transcriptional regulator
MDKNNVLILLNTIKTKKYVGSMPVEVITFAIEKELVERTEIGNFQLTQKGLDLLDKKLDWKQLQDPETVKPQ